MQFLSSALPAGIEWLAFLSATPGVLSTTALAGRKVGAWISSYFSRPFRLLRGFCASWRTASTLSPIQKCAERGR